MVSLKYCVNHKSMWDHEDKCETEVVRFFEDPYRTEEKCKFLILEAKPV